MSLPALQRTACLCGCLLLGAVGLAHAQAGSSQASAGVASASVPAFVAGSIYSANAAPVLEVMPTLAADVVMLGGGLNEGLRRGMLCRIVRGAETIGEIIIIESRSDRAAGLILDLSGTTSIQAGDIARIKTIQNS